MDPSCPVQEGQAIPHTNTDLSPHLNSRSYVAANNGTNMALNQANDAVVDAARLGPLLVALRNICLLETAELLVAA
jgi:hypothetical protein